MPDRQDANNNITNIQQIFLKPWLRATRLFKVKILKLRFETLCFIIIYIHSDLNHLNNG